jgi:glutamyl-tRNA reductase
VSNLKAISLSYKNTPVQVRELFSFDEAGCKELYFRLKEQFDLTECLIVSTCNRTEIYYTSDIDINNSLIDFLLSSTKVGEQAQDLKEYFVKIDNNDEAVKYLFEVSAGLHAQIVGDIQISGQIKDAYQWAADVNMAGPFLHRLMHAIFYTNKKITQETAFRDGAASISYAATELVDDITLSNKFAKILLVGTGEIGTDVAKNLISFGYKNITISNRTIARAEALAKELSKDFNVQILPFEHVISNIQYFDIVLSSIQIEKPFFTYESLKDLKIFSHKYFIDLSVPRSVDQNIEKIPGIISYNIEDLNKKTSETQAKRLAAIPQVQQIIQDSVEEFKNWSREMEVSPTIHKIKNALETIRLEELNRYQKQLSEDEIKMVDTITKNIIQKIVKFPVLQLKAACKRGEQESLVEVLNELFDLDKQKVKN